MLMPFQTWVICSMQNKPAVSVDIHIPLSLSVCLNPSKWVLYGGLSLRTVVVLHGFEGMSN